MQGKLLLFISVILVTSCSPLKKERFQAYYAVYAPIIDGEPNDTIWNAIAEWNTDYFIWVNNVNSAPSVSDFSWRYKLAWDEKAFYVLAEITDERLYDIYPDPTINYWEDDCFEVLFDEDNSGGDHQSSYQAFVYHISTKYDAVDIDSRGDVVLLNDHLQVRMDTVNGKYFWEAAFSVFDKNYTSTSKSTPVKLYRGKVMGWAMAYCDNDGGKERDHFFGTNNIPGEDKNLTWKSADAFGEVELVD